MMLCGKPPFYDDEPQIHLQLMMEDDHMPDIEEDMKEVSDDAVDLIKAMLAKDPN